MLVPQISLSGISAADTTLGSYVNVVQLLKPVSQDVL